MFLFRDWPGRDGSFLRPGRVAALKSGQHIMLDLPCRAAEGASRREFRRSVRGVPRGPGCRRSRPRDVQRGCRGFRDASRGMHGRFEERRNDRDGRGRAPGPTEWPAACPLPGCAARPGAAGAGLDRALAGRAGRHGLGSRMDGRLGRRLGQLDAQLGRPVPLATRLGPACPHPLRPGPLRPDAAQRRPFSPRPIQPRPIKPRPVRPAPGRLADPSHAPGLAPTGHGHRPATVPATGPAVGRSTGPAA